MLDSALTKCINTIIINLFGGLLSKYLTSILFLSALLSDPIKAEEEKQLDPSKQEMAEYKKHCLILGEFSQHIRRFGR